MDDMLLEKDGKRIQITKEEFAASVDCKKQFMDKLDDFTKSIHCFKSNDDYLIGNNNKDGRYCGRYNCENNIWIGAFFDTDKEPLRNKLVVGFCVFDTCSKEADSSQFIPLEALQDVMQKYPFIKEKALDDGGYWIYFILENIANDLLAEVIKGLGRKAMKLIKSILKNVRKHQKKAKTNKKSTCLKHSGNCNHAGYWIYKILLLVLVGFLFLLGRSFFPKSISFDKPIGLEIILQLIYFVVLLVAIILLIITFFKGTTGLKIEKLNELYLVKQKILGDSFDNSFDTITEETDSQPKKTIITQKSNKADLLKHYMTCITEL